MNQAGTDQAPSMTTGVKVSNTSTATTTTTTTTTTTSGGNVEDVAGSCKGPFEQRSSGTDPTLSAPRFIHSSLADERTEMAAIPSAAPALPPHYVERPALLRRAVNVLTRKCVDFGLTGSHPYHLRVLLGANGAGKTVLASSIVRCPEIRKEFWRGVFWVTTKIGRGGCCGTNGGRFLGLLRGLVAEIEGGSSDPTRARDGEKCGGGDRYGNSTRGRTSAATVVSGESYSPQRLACVEEAILRLADANSRTNRRLLVLDDVCNAEVAFELVRAGFVVLVTTTSADALSLERGTDRRVSNIEVPSDMTHQQAFMVRKKRRGEQAGDMELRGAADGMAGAPAGSKLHEVICLFFCFPRLLACSPPC